MLTGIFKKQDPKYPINPRFRAYGKARLDIARRAATGSDWDKLWKDPAFPFPFDWGEWWKQCIEYKVEDFAAEVGFYTDILGLPVVAFDPNYAMFTSPAQDFFLAIVPALEPGKSTPVDALRIQFMVADIFETVRELERRGIVFEQKPQPCERGSSLYITYFRTPHGLCVDLWGVVAVGTPLDEEIEIEEEEFEVSVEPAHLERPESTAADYPMNFHERERGDDSDRFEDDEEETPSDYNAGLRFFVEPASQFSERVEENETGTLEELNFGNIEPEAGVKKTPWQSNLFEQEKPDEEDEEDFDEEEEAEDDDSSPYEYINVDDA